MSLLLNGDCLEELNNVDDDGVDLIFCDLPYGQTSCKWDCKIDLKLFFQIVSFLRLLELHRMRTIHFSLVLEKINR